MSEDKLYAMRHSLAHIMASAVQRLWPEAKFGIGPVVENGFYYDIDLGETKISEQQFAKIEKVMRKIITEKQEFVRSVSPINEAIDWADKAHQPYKSELLNDLKRAGTTVAKDLDASEMGTIAEGDSALDEVSFYTNGDFKDLCRGPHVENTKEVGAFKLMRVAGAYWRGSEKNPQMQRLYGVAFETQEELDTHLEMLEQAKLRDHRKLGKELDLFHVSDLIGAGLPLITPRGSVLRELLSDYSQVLQGRAGFKRVWTPHIAKTDIYKVSGHYDKYPERFEATSEESDDVFMLKPMNCPHHIQLFLREPHSYRDMPIRYMENTTNYRDEKSGELHGLSRVRSLSQDDGHIFCREGEVEDEIRSITQMVVDLYAALDMEFYARLSYRDDGDGYLGSDEVWQKAEAAIAKVAKEFQFKSIEEHGEAAFYGPKIDFMVKDSLGREWQCATVQLDFVQPERFGLEYIDEGGDKQRPVIIHKALLGSIERFMSVYIEHTAGWFPFWLAPEQVRILTINDTVMDYVGEIEEVLSGVVLMQPVKYNEIRFSVDSRNESLGKKIREATTMKIPVQLIVGPKDKEAREVSVRTQNGEEKVALDELSAYLKGM